MRQREELLAAVWARLDRVTATGDTSAVREPGALDEVWLLEECITDDAGERDDLEVEYILGWVYYHRAQGVPPEQAGRELEEAVGFFMPCFLAGVEELPETVLPRVAEAAYPTAHALLRLVSRDAPDPSLVENTVGLWRRVTHHIADDHPDRATCLAGLCLTLQIQFRHTEDPDDLDGAVEAGRAAVDAAPDNHPQRGTHLSSLSSVLQGQFERTGRLSDLDEAVDVGRDAVRATPDDDHGRAIYLFNLGLALMRRFERTGRLSDLDEAVDVGRGAVRATPDDGPDATYLFSLSDALRQRFERTGVLSDLEEAVRVGRTAVDVTPDDDPERGMYLSSLANALLLRFKDANDLGDLDQAVEYGRAAVRFAFDRAKSLSSLGIALRQRFEWTGVLSDLDEALEASREAVQVASADGTQEAMFLLNLCAVLLRRSQRTGVLSDLEEAVRVGRTAVDVTPDDDPERGKALSNLGIALQERFERTGESRDVEEAVQVGRAAVLATPDDHPERASYLMNLGSALRSRFGRTGLLEDVEEAVRTGRAAVEATADEHPSLAMRLSNFSLSLEMRFGRTGELRDLEEAVEVSRTATETVPDHHSERSYYLLNLGNAMQKRFERTGDLRDLEEAVEVTRTAIEIIADEHPERPRFLSALGAALQSRFERTKDLRDLEEAVEMARTAVRSTPDDHPVRAHYLSNLGTALHMLFEQTADSADLDEAVEVGRTAFEAIPDDHPDGATCLSSLGISLHMRFGHTREPSDADGAVEAFRGAVRLTSPDHPIRTECLANLGIALESRFKLTEEPADRDDALSAWEQAVEMETASPRHRVRTARWAASLAAPSDRVRASGLLERAVLMLPEVAPRQLARSDQQYALGGLAGLAGDAAALALDDTRGTASERAARAVRLLEAGRAVLLSQVLDTRSDLTDLRQQHPELAARFVELRDRLDQSADASGPATGASSAPGTRSDRQDRLVADQHRLAREFGATLAEIRDAEEFASFGLPPTTEELLAQADQGPVVVFNISGYRSDALLLTETGITTVPLPELTPTTLIDHINAFRQALGDAVAGTSAAQRREAQATLTRILEWLWDTAAGPVLTALGHHRPPVPGAVWPRVWWAPGGLLGLLPVHAAGYHTDPADDPERRTVIDRVISSYTPTVRALHYARQHTRGHGPASPSPTRALVVALPTTPGLPGHGRLHYVRAEAEMLHRHLPGRVLLHEPDPDHDTADNPASLPTKAGVLAHLPTCAIAHFACHGASHPTDPSRSRLLLHDHNSDPLTVASLAPIQLDQAQLAYLSACRTAAIDTTELLDEAIHLTSAFQLAGFPHVIGTLWEINDQIAVTVADAFYTHLTTDQHTLDTDRAADALHHAIRAVRDGHDLPGDLDRTRTPSLWAAYLHAGA